MTKLFNIFYIFLSVIAIITVIFFKSSNIFAPVFNELLGNTRVVIIDAGHGGLDGGTSSKEGVLESEIALEISLKTKDLCDFLGIPNVMTRYDENSLNFDPEKGIRDNKILDTRARESLVNSFENAFLVSIHLNSFPDENVSGAQVFYNDFEDAKLYAETLDKNLTNTLGNDRVAQEAPSSVYLIKNSNHPSIIFEAGFLSNASDTEKVIDPNYQIKLAMNLVASLNEKDY